MDIVATCVAMLTEDPIPFPAEECAENFDEHTLDGKSCSKVAFAFSILKPSSDSLVTE